MNRFKFIFGGVVLRVLALSLAACGGGGGGSGGGSTSSGCGGVSVGNTILTVSNVSDVVNGDVSCTATLIANPGPDGVSLREAILAVNATPGPHTITFAATLSGATVALTSPLLVTRDGVTLTGFTDTWGQPAIILDGRGITAQAEVGGVILAYASDFTMSRLAVTGVKDIGVRIQAGATTSPPTAPPTVNNIRIENNVFDNAGVVVGPFPAAIRVWTDPAGVAANATIAGVRIAHNTFRNFSDSGIIVSASGSNCTIQNLVVEANSFTDIPFQVELGFHRGSNNRILGTRITDNIFVNGTALLWIGAIASDSGPQATDNVIDDTIVSGNVFSGSGDSLNIVGGFTGGQLTSAIGNTVRNTVIVNNLLTADRGIHIAGGGAGGTGNNVDGVRIVNNTIVTPPLFGFGLRVDVNQDGGSGNTVAGVSVLNTIFRKRRPEPQNPEAEIVGDITSDQVSFSITTAPGFAGVNGNIAADPKFVNPAQGDFHLQAGSPAIDAGSGTGAPTRDLECRTRVDDPGTPNTGAGTPAFVDIGAYEFSGGTPNCAANG